MFSGIVQGTTRLASSEDLAGLRRLYFDGGKWSKDLEQGASVSIAGVCLTATTMNGQNVTFEVMRETCQKTTLGKMRVGALANIERSLRIGEEIGGHRVSGHVTGITKIRAIEEQPHYRILTFSCPHSWIDTILPKGFIALDGCSLTIVETGSDWFTVHLIPETLRVTTFGIKKIGDEVNLELDSETVAIVTTVKRYLKEHHLASL